MRRYTLQPQVKQNVLLGVVAAVNVMMVMVVVMVMVMVMGERIAMHVIMVMW